MSALRPRLLTDLSKQKRTFALGLSITGHMARADWLMINGQEIVAANHYGQVIAKQPNNVAALNNLAWLLREDSEGRALELDSLARELAPESAAVLDTNGWVLHLAGRHSEAKPVIEKHFH